MDCTLIETELVSFHFGTLSEEARAPLEAHLLGCARCLGSFIATKRALDTSEGEVGASERPSEIARERLRAAVARTIARPRRARWFVGGAAAAAALFVVWLGVFAPPSRSPATPATTDDPAQVIDSARPNAANLSFL